MPKINVLPKEVYQLIAAGEVVERPSSIVKEMIENSVDAGAKNITIEIKNGGTTYIRITDDGCGISKEDVKNVFVSHATSKISNATDLDSIATLGFRGEAMASIGAVAKVELLTCAQNEDLGTRYEIAGGEEIDFSQAGCPKGTTIVVRDIFFNTPARMKFLKKDVTEGNSVAGIVDRMAISHPEIAFRFIRDGKQTLITSGNGDLKSTIYSVFGKEFSQSLIDVDYSINNMRITGVVTKPADSRKSRAMQFFFINNRLVKCQTAMAALEQAFRNSIMVGRFPGCVLNIQCDNSFVDVNVHPAKIEVRFVNEKPIFDLVYYGVKSAIEMGDSFKQAQFTPKAEKSDFSGNLFGAVKQPKPTQMEFKAQTQSPDDFWVISSSTNYQRVTPQPKQADSTKPIISPDKSDSKSFQTTISQPQKLEAQHHNSNDAQGSANQPKVSEPKVVEDVPDFKIVGEAFKTYIIAEIDKELYFIDKHAAHERMNYEQLKSSTQISSQILLTPVAVKLAQDEYSVVCDSLDLYKSCGFLVEDFGNGVVMVRECPSLLNGEDVEDLIHETAQALLEGKIDITPEKMDWIFHSTSCRSAVKAGDFTSPYEQQLFVKKLLSMPNIRYCPHGRPVLIKISKYDIEKQFGRV